MALLYEMVPSALRTLLNGEGQWDLLRGKEWKTSSLDIVRIWDLTAEEQED